MKCTVAVGLALVGFLLVGFWLLHGGQVAGQPPKLVASNPKEPRKLHTSGSATVRVTPNRARLFLAVVSTATAVKQARAANKKDVEAVIAAIQRLKLPKLKMQSTDVQIEAIMSKDEKQTIKIPTVLGYRVTYTFTVLVSNDDPQKLAALASQVLDTALESGANAVQQVSVFRDDMTEARRQALTKATADAVANAKAIAAGDNRTITDIIIIDDNPEYGRILSTSNVTAVGTLGLSWVAGDVEVTCRVSITCTYGASK